MVGATGMEERRTTCWERDVMNSKHNRYCWKTFNHLKIHHLVNIVSSTFHRKLAYFKLRVPHDHSSLCCLSSQSRCCSQSFQSELSWCSYRAQQTLLIFFHRRNKDCTFLRKSAGIVVSDRYIAGALNIVEYPVTLLWFKQYWRLCPRYLVSVGSYRYRVHNFQICYKPG